MDICILRVLCVVRLIIRSEESCGVSHWVWSWSLDNKETLTHLGPSSHWGEGGVWSIVSLQCVWQIYIHKVPVILHNFLQHKSHKPYGSPTSVTWLQLMRKQNNTGSFTAVIAEKQWPTRTRLHEFSRLVTSARASWHYLRLKLETLWNYYCYIARAFWFIFTSILLLI